MSPAARHHDHDHADGELHDHDRGLSHDLPKLLGRRRALALFGGGSIAVLAAGCAADATTSTSSSTTSSAGASAGGPGAGGPPDGGGPGGGMGGDSSVEVGDGEIPEETAGPYPGDGSNGANVLSESGIVRSDITSSFGSASAVAEGVPLTIRLTVVDVSSATDAGTPLAGAAIYLWHCDREGNYSLYSEAVADENYLRGVQETAADGTVTFTSIYPACYSGRWPHIHFEVYPSLAEATSSANKMRTSQIALPDETNELVYATDGYDASVRNLSQVSLDSDGIFSDGYSLQLATMTGSVDEGYTATLRVPV